MTATKPERPFVRITDGTASTEYALAHSRIDAVLSELLAMT